MPADQVFGFDLRHMVLELIDSIRPAAGCRRFGSFPLTSALILVMFGYAAASANLAIGGLLIVIGGMVSSRQSPRQNSGV